jgi:hypothetical protein
MANNRHKAADRLAEVIDRHLPRIVEALTGKSDIDALVWSEIIDAHRSWKDSLKDAPRR